MPDLLLEQTCNPEISRSLEALVASGLVKKEMHSRNKFVVVDCSETIERSITSSALYNRTIVCHFLFVDRGNV